MRTLNQWFDEYAESHQNETNQLIHYICVPAIFFSIVGVLMSIPTNFLTNIFGLNNPYIENWGTVALIFLLIFYLRLSFSMFLKIFGVFSNMHRFKLFFRTKLPLLYKSLTIFVIAWIGQFYGHKIEGKKPSFLKDLQFSLIGPEWVIKKNNVKIIIQIILKREKSILILSIYYIFNKFICSRT